jgi:hypothetical protein
LKFSYQKETPAHARYSRRQHAAVMCIELPASGKILITDGLGQLDLGGEANKLRHCKLTPTRAYKNLNKKNGNLKKKLFLELNLQQACRSRSLCSEDIYLTSRNVTGILERDMTI